MKKPVLTKIGSEPCQLHPGSHHDIYMLGEPREIVHYEAKDAKDKISSGVSSEAFRMGWDRIFGSDKPSN